ncbi:CidA/LrgA family protein [Alkalicoccobacillus murimartini]|uniref:Holin-like protein n=1 Tax=Alkalicoccobacillus murimartini TaxID=171685 RepID=A0ABT9YJY6_9BACI|nr:CidA/LrgA family protein [Alkalicoccobacillus murimartini]MDQ0208176.1 holin-like protein [Alkalicoccobacillus murimartini]
MKSVGRIILHLLILSVFYCIGMALQTWLSIPLPGSLVGMILLFICLSSQVVPVRFVDQGAEWILKHLSLMFIPIIAGIVTFPILFTSRGLSLILLTMFSTLLVIVLSGLISQYLALKQERKSS